MVIRRMRSTITHDCRWRCFARAWRLRVSSRQSAHQFQLPILEREHRIFAFGRWHTTYRGRGVQDRSCSENERSQTIAAMARLFDSTASCCQRQWACTRRMLSWLHE